MQTNIWDLENRGTAKAASFFLFDIFTCIYRSESIQFNINQYVSIRIQNPK